MISRRHLSMGHLPGLQATYRPTFTTEYVAEKAKAESGQTLASKIIRKDRGDAFGNLYDDQIRCAGELSSALQPVLEAIISQAPRGSRLNHFRNKWQRLNSFISQECVKTLARSPQFDEFINRWHAADRLLPAEGGKAKAMIAITAVIDMMGLLLISSERLSPRYCTACGSKQCNNAEAQ